MSKELYIKCECQNEILAFTADPDDGLINIALYTYGQGFGKPSLWQRIKFGWYHLRTGKIYADAVVISNESRNKLQQWLSKETTL